jgi:hypothetical protein
MSEASNTANGVRKSPVTRRPRRSGAYTLLTLGLGLGS